MSELILYLVISPFAAALLAYAFGKIDKQIAFWISEILTLSLFIAVLYLFFHYTNPISVDINWFKFGHFSIPIGLYIDHLSMVMLLIVSGLGFLDIHYSHDYMAEDPHQPRYYGYMLFFIGGMILLVSAKQLSGLFTGWELMGLASYLLISFWHEQKAPADSGVSAFLYTKAGDIFLFASLGLLFYYAGTLNMVTIDHLATSGKISSHVSFVVAIFILIAALGKSGQFPFFPWLLRAMEGPTTVSALIHGATMVNSGIYIVARLFGFYAAGDALIVVASIAALGVFVGATSALVQSEMKRVLAYSTMSHLALAFVGLGVGSLAAGMMHLSNHAIFKALLFLGAGAVMLSTNDTKDMWRFGGLKKPLFLVAIFMAMGALSLGGIPPFSGYFSKDAIFATTIATNHGDIITALTLIGGLLSIAYITRMWILIFAGKPRDIELFNAVKAPSKFWISLPLGIMAVTTLVLGFFQKDLADYIISAKYIEPHIAHMMPVILGAIISLAGIMYYFYYLRLDLVKKLIAQPLIKSIHNILLNGYYVERFITWFTHNIMVDFLAKVVTYIDTHLLDAAIDGTNDASHVVFNRLSKTNTKKSGDYTGGVIFLVGLVILTVMIGARA